MKTSFATKIPVEARFGSTYLWLKPLRRGKQVQHLDRPTERPFEQTKQNNLMARSGEGQVSKTVKAMPEKCPGCLTNAKMSQLSNQC